MKDVIRILQVIPDLILGGAEQIVVDLALHLDPEKFEVAVLSMFPPAGRPIESDLAAKGIRVWYMGKRLGLDLRMLTRMDAVIREFKPHIAHTHCYALVYLLPLILARRAPAVVHTVHNIGMKDAYGVPWLVWLAYRCGVTPVAVGEEVARSLRRLHRLKSVPVIRNGIQVQRYKPAARAREQARRNMGLDARDIVFISVGRISSQKNHAMLLNCFRRVVAEIPRSRLLIAGAGELESELRRMISSLGLDGSVRFLGVRDDVPALLAAGDIFVLSSLWEGCPLAIMEAMAAGAAVVSTAVGCVPEILRDGVTGRLVQPNDADAFTRAMTDLARDPVARRNLAARASAEADQRFDLSAMVRSYSELYLNVAQGAGFGVSSVV
jgi:glycosyltransferase involved in cell wall biosynthesis